MLLFKVVHISLVFLLIQWRTCASSPTISLYVNPAAGNDGLDCGFSTTTSCQTLNYTILRGLGVVDIGGTVLILMQASISNEKVIIADEHHLSTRIELQPADGVQVTISNTLITALTSM